MTTILLAEDDLSLRKKYEDSLKKENFIVILACTAEEILEKFRCHRPEIIISDTVLANETYGNEACEELHRKGELENKLVIGISSSAQSRNSWYGVAYAFYNKNFLGDEIGKIIRSEYESYLTTSRKSLSFTKV